MDSAYPCLAQSALSLLRYVDGVARRRHAVERHADRHVGLRALDVDRDRHERYDGRRRHRPLLVDVRNGAGVFGARGGGHHDGRGPGGLGGGVGWRRQRLHHQVAVEPRVAMRRDDLFLQTVREHHPAASPLHRSGWPTHDAYTLSSRGPTVNRFLTESTNSVQRWATEPVQISRRVPTAASQTGVARW